jgi:hypothetical protein
MLHVQGGASRRRGEWLLWLPILAALAGTFPTRWETTGSNAQLSETASGAKVAEPSAMRTRLRLLALCIALAGHTTACLSEVADEDAETSVLEVDEERKDDGYGELRVRAADMTLWAEPLVQPRDDGAWVVAARSSYDIAALSASIGDAATEAAQTSARKFEVRLDGRQLVTSLGGTPLLVEITTTSGRVRAAMFGTRARTGYSSGSYRIYPWRNITGVITGGETFLRARLTTPTDIERVVGLNDDDSEPMVRREDARRWIADFPASAFPSAASPTEDPVVYVAENAAGDRYSRDVHMTVELGVLGVTSSEPNEAWPAPVCEELARGCVEDLGRDADLEPCGSVAEVGRCLDELPEPDDIETLKRRFADGLRRALLEFYAAHEVDVVASGGNPRTEALRSVDTADMEEVHDPDEIPSGHDLGRYRVLTHPDVVFPGSDTVWFGVLDRESGELVEVFDFN